MCCVRAVALVRRAWTRCLSIIAMTALVGCFESPNKSGATRIASEESILVRSSLDFGDLAHGSGVATRNIQVSNVTSADISVSRWVASCDCLSIEPLQLDIRAGKERVIHVTFDPDKEGDAFVGSLLVEVKGYAGDLLVARFSVPVVVR